MSTQFKNHKTKSMSNPKFSGYNENDTFWDDYHRKNGMMTNREFFTSNAKGGFYEGMEWDGKQWVPDQETRSRIFEYEKSLCPDCQCKNCTCW